MHAMREGLIALWQSVARGYDACLDEIVGDLILELQAMSVSLAEAKPVRVRFGLPQTTRDGVITPMAFSIPIDRVLTIPLVFTNAAGQPVPGPGGGSVTVSDGAAASATTDDAHVVVTPNGAAGTAFTVNYSVGTLSTGDVEFVLGEGDVVVPPPDPTAAVAVMMDFGAATVAPKGSAPVPPTPAPPVDPPVILPPPSDGQPTDPTVPAPVDPGALPPAPDNGAQPSNP